MLSQCANSKCGRSFLRLGEGKLFLVETEFGADRREPTETSVMRLRKSPWRVERYWLCDQCADAWTLAQDRNGIVLLPLPPPPPGGAGSATRPEFRQTS
jgi:hypothetical protein